MNTNNLKIKLRQHKLKEIYFDFSNIIIFDKSIPLRIFYKNRYQPFIRLGKKT